MHETRAMGAADVFGFDVGCTAGASDDVEAALLRASFGSEAVEDIFHIRQNRTAAHDSEMMQWQEVQQNRRV